MSWTHIEDRHPVAGRPHQCYLCEREIIVGEKHVRRTGITADGLLCFRMHEACSAKTSDWDQCCWDSHEAAAFREYELEEAEVSPPSGIPSSEVIGEVQAP